MKALPFLLLFPLVAIPANAATAYFAFQSGVASGSSFQGTVTSNVGFASDPTIAKTNGSASSVDGGGQGSFMDPNNPSDTYLGTGGGVTSVNSYGWNVDISGGQSFTGAAFTVSVNLTELTDLSIAFGLRAAGSSTAGIVPLSFKSIEYSLGDSGVWESAGVASPTWTVSGAYSNKSVNFSALSEIEGQSDVRIRFTLADTDLNPTTGTASSIRIDNLVIEAVPEPSSAVLMLGSALALASRRRR